MRHGAKPAAKAQRVAGKPRPGKRLNLRSGFAAATVLGLATTAVLPSTAVAQGAGSISMASAFNVSQSITAADAPITSFDLGIIEVTSEQREAVNRAGEKVVYTGGWVAPLPAGQYRTTCPMYCYPGHTGHDFGGATGTPIYAAAAGEVSFAGWESTGGNTVFIQHGDGIESWYGHMVSQPVVKVGDVVEAGQLIGYMGSTGVSTGTHLHFEVRINNRPVNARDFLAANGVTVS